MTGAAGRWAGVAGKRQRWERPLKVAVAAMLVAAVSIVGVDVAAPSNAGHILIFMYDLSTVPSSPVLVTGALGDYGTLTEETAAGLPEITGNFLHVSLQRGTFVINITALERREALVPLSVNMITCSVSHITSASTTISEGRATVVFCFKPSCAALHTPTSL